MSTLLAAILMVVSARSASAAIAIDVTTFRDLASASTTMTTPAFSTAATNELLLAEPSRDNQWSGGIGLPRVREEELEPRA